MLLRIIAPSKSILASTLVAPVLLLIDVTSSLTEVIAVALCTAVPLIFSRPVVVDKLDAEMRISFFALAS